jgi:hypothetical protein
MRIRIRILNADPDPGGNLNGDPCGSWSETLLGTMFCPRNCVHIKYSNYLPGGVNWMASSWRLSEGGPTTSSDVEVGARSMKMSGTWKKIVWFVMSIMKIQNQKWTCRQCFGSGSAFKLLPGSGSAFILSGSGSASRYFFNADPDPSLDPAPGYHVPFLSRNLKKILQLIRMPSFWLIFFR